MSTIHFDARELGNVARYLASEFLSIQTVSSWLAAYSEANTEEYNRRYNADAKPETAEAIAFQSSRKCDEAKALGTINLLRYNASDVSEETEIKVNRVLLSILEVAFSEATAAKRI